MEKRKMTRDEFMSVLSEIFQNEPDNDKFNYILECADEYAECMIEEKKLAERIQFGKDVCENAGESIDDLPDKVFISIADNVEDRILSNSGDVEYEVVTEVIREYWESEESGNACATD